METEIPAVLQEDDILKSINDDTRVKLKARLAKMDEDGLLPAVERARLYAGYDHTLMLSADRDPSHPARPISLEIILNRPANG